MNYRMQKSFLYPDNYSILTYKASLKYLKFFHNRRLTFKIKKIRVLNQKQSSFYLFTSLLTSLIK